MTDIDMFGRCVLAAGAVCMFLTAMVLSKGVNHRFAPLVWILGLGLVIISAIGRF